MFHICFIYFYLAFKTTTTIQQRRQQLDINDTTTTTMQRHNNNLTIQYACGTNQRWSNKLLKATLEYKLLKANNS